MMDAGHHRTREKICIFTYRECKISMNYESMTTLIIRNCAKLVERSLLESFISAVLLVWCVIPDPQICL